MSKVLKARPRSGQEIERIAHNIILSYQPDAAKSTVSFDVEAFFEFELQARTKIEAIQDHLPEEIDGYTDSEKMRCVISLKLVEYGDCQMTKRRLRSTLAHEIGHCYLHVEEARKNRAYQQLFTHDKNSRLKMYDPTEIKVYENPEWQAWRFASALLMPENCFRIAVERNFTKKQLQRAFDVNPSFVDVRMRELKITKRLVNGC